MSDTAVPRRVVVVGATGNIGSGVVEALAADPTVESIVGVARRAPEWSPPKTQWHMADLAEDQLDLESIFSRADAVIHTAWLFQPSHQPTVTWQANVTGTIRLIDAVLAAGVPALLYASSVGAYSPRSLDAADIRVDEQWPTHGWPTAAYTREKAYVERLLDVVERDHPALRVVRMRPAFVFSRRSASQQRRLFAGPLVPQRLIRPGLLPVTPTLRELRMQVVHTADVAEAFRLALHRPVRGAFNLAADDAVDLEKVAELLSARALPVPTALARAALAGAWHAHLMPSPPDLFDAMLHLPLMATSRARDELGWAPRHDAAEVLQEFLAGLRDAAGADTPPLEPSSVGGRATELRGGVGEAP